MDTGNVAEWVAAIAGVVGAIAAVVAFSVAAREYFRHRRESRLQHYSWRKD